MKKLLTTPVCETKCSTCPFREGSPYANLAEHLTESALTDGNRICHSTGSSAINRRTGKPAMICRGSRDIQLKLFHAKGVIKEPTDAAWYAKIQEINTKRK